jgi:hypothetical protein
MLQGFKLEAENHAALTVQGASAGGLQQGRTACMMWRALLSSGVYTAKE